jgi:hypothetical protein
MTFMYQTMTEWQKTHKNHMSKYLFWDAFKNKLILLSYTFEILELLKRLESRMKFIALTCFLLVPFSIYVYQAFFYKAGNEDMLIIFLCLIVFVLVVFWGFIHFYRFFAQCIIKIHWIHNYNIYIFDTSGLEYFVKKYDENYFYFQINEWIREKFFVEKIYKADKKITHSDKTNHWIQEKKSQQGIFVEMWESNIWPYEKIFSRIDTYYQEKKSWKKISLFPNKEFNNSEIFLENDDIILWIGQRNILWKNEWFVDLINIKTHKTYRILTTELNYIYNTKDTLVVSAKIWETFYEITFDIWNLEILSQSVERKVAFFNKLYSYKTKKWTELIFQAENTTHEWWYFIPQKMDLNVVPLTYDSTLYRVNSTIALLQL